MRIRSSIMWSGLGTIIPIFGAVIAIPPLIAAMGDARFGILSLAWVLVGYFGFFDLGLGRALTHLIAQRKGEGRDKEIPSIICSGIFLMAALGLLGGLILAGLSPWLVGNILSIPEQMRPETLIALFYLSLSIPIVIVTTGFRGILEGIHRFDLVNIVKAPLGALTYLAPLLVLPFTRDLPDIVASLVAVRLLSLIAYTAICLRTFPAILSWPSRVNNQLRELISFGGWLTVSNIAGPLLLYLGRFLLIALVSAEAVAYFSTPYDIVINLILIPGVFVSVLFPTFAQQFQSRSEAVRPFYMRWQRNTLLCMLPLCLLAFLIAKQGLSIWISPEFAGKSYIVAQILAVGIFINSFGHIAQSLIQAYGRPDLTAKLHVLELITYVPYLWWLVSNYEIEGAAIAWVIRVSISTVFLIFIANHCLSGKLNSKVKDPAPC